MSCFVVDVVFDQLEVTSELENLAVDTEYNQLVVNRECFRVVPAGPVNYLLNEDGTYLLNEDGSRFIL